ncbi:MAG TPA: dienelactone hydrolase family protein [Saprospiraceae bacterium]|nr:dienelactone hydrolase family protein [Saprospiraceae bacterium]HMP12559.1 dienelactone hydrolase family protein [Saprospiraceae bacterium]
MHEYNILEKGKPIHQASKAIILLHGRGGSAHDIIALADEFCDESFYIAAPQASNHTWYPYSFLAPANQNEPWLSSAIAIVNQLIDETAKEIGIEQVYLMGFSQGACLTLEVAARNAKPFAGVVAFTGGLIGDSLIVSNYKGNFGGSKIFIGNSNIDPHVPLARSEESKIILEQLGADVTLKVYPNMPHTIIADEINTVKSLMF